MCTYIMYISLALQAYFSGGTIPKCKIHFLGPPLKCKIRRLHFGYIPPPLERCFFYIMCGSTTPGPVRGLSER